MKIKINKAIPSKKSAATIDGVMFQESRDLGDIATSPNGANGATRSVAISYSANTIPQSLSDSKLTANASGIDSSKTNIIDVEAKVANGASNGMANGSSNGKKMMLNGKQRANTIANGLQPNGNASSELIAG